ncbi:GNAT family N-acetyltransferase [Candidatus Falkowbacteria bacterium]|nr:GNAT family N-acetyltransferase [Candidatus Falkowbacteria bacterium]
MAEIRMIDDAEEKSAICEAILRDLREWFEVEEPLLDYIKNVKSKMFAAAFINSMAVGFICLDEINPSVSEIYVTGVKREHHRQGIGRELLNYVETLLVDKDKKYLLVKTLSDRRPDEFYDRTKKFYLNSDFTPLCELDIWGPENPCLLMIKSLG